MPQASSLSLLGRWTLGVGCWALILSHAIAAPLEHKLGIDGTDERPLRVVVRLCPTYRTPQTSVSLEWSGGVAVGLTTTNTAGVLVPKLVWHDGRKSTVLTSRYHLNPWGQPNTVRFIVQTRTVDIAASRGGLVFRHLGTLRRTRPASALPPALLRIERADVERVSIDNGPFELPDVESLGYVKRAGWEATEAAMPARLTIGPLRLFQTRRPPASDSEVAPMFKPGLSLPIDEILVSLDPVRSGGVATWRTTIENALRKLIKGRDFLAVAATDVVADESCAIEVRCDFHPHGQVFLNGRPMTATTSTVDHPLTHGRICFSAPVNKGTNRLVVAVWNVPKEKCRNHAVFLSVRRHDPAARLALLERLTKDFPDAAHLVHEVDLQNSRLQESLGFFRRSSDAFLPDTAARIVRTAQLEARLGQFKAAADTIAGIRQPAIVQPALSAIAEGWRAAERAGPRGVLVPALPDSPMISGFEQLLRSAEQLKQERDFAEAAMVYRAIVDTPVSDDLVVDSLLNLLGIQKRFGLGDYSYSTLLGTGHLAPDKPALAAALADSLATHREPALVGFRPPVSTEALRLLEATDRAVDAEEWDRAVDLLQALMSSHPDALAASGDYIRGVRAHVQATLLAMPKPGIEAYEKRFGVTASQPFRQAAASQDPATLVAAARAFPGGHAAAHALNSAATLYLDRGHPNAAAALLARLAVAGRSTPEMLAKWALAAERAGLPTQAVQALSMLRRRFSDRSLKIRGRTRQVTDYVAAQLSRIARNPTTISPPPTGGTASVLVPPAAGPSATEAWRRLFRGTPTDDAMAFLGWPHPYTLSAYAPVLRNDTVFVQSSEDVFAFNARDGAMRWATTRPMPHLAPGAWDHPKPAVLRPDVSDNIVVARVRSRGPANGEQLWVLEARRLNDGRAAWSTEGNSRLSDVRFVTQPTIYADRVLALSLRQTDKADVQLVALDARDGRVLWRTTLTGDMTDLFEGEYMWNRRAHVAYFRNQRDPRKERRTRLQYDHCGPPVVADGVCYAVTDIGIVAAVDTFDGSVLWMRSYPRARYPSGSSAESRLQSMRAPPRILVSGQNLVFAPRDTLGVLCLNRGDGHTAWRRDYTAVRRLVGLVDTEPIGPVVVAEGTAVEGLDVETGRRLWRWKPDPAAHGRLRHAAVDGARVLATCERGIARLAAGTGRLEGFENVKTGNTESHATPDTRHAHSALRDVPSYPGCKHISGGPARIEVADSTHVLAWIGDRLTLIDAAAEKPVWSRRLHRGAIHTAMARSRIAQVFPEQVLILDRSTGKTVRRVRAPITDGAKPKIERITAAQGRDNILAIGGGTAVHVMDIGRGENLCAFELSYPVRSMAVLTNAILTMSRSTERHEPWRADLHSIPSGKTLAGHDLKCRRSWRTPPAAAANAKHGALAAFVEGTVLHYRAGREDPPLRAAPATGNADLLDIRTDGDRVTLVHRANEKNRGSATGTVVIDIKTGKPVFNHSGTWAFWPDLSIGTLHRTRVHKDRVGAEHTAYLIQDRSGRLTCRGVDGEVAWERRLPMAYESSRGWWRKGNGLLELVVRSRWADVFGNYAEDVWEEMFQRWPGGEPDRTFPALDARPDGTSESALRRIDLKTGAITMLGSLPGFISGPRGQGTAVMCAERLVYAAEQGLFLVSSPGGRTAAALKHSDALRSIPFVDRAIQVDGLLDDWTDIDDAAISPETHQLGEQATCPTGSSAAGGSPPAAPTTEPPTVKLAWDDLRLCVAVSVPGGSDRPAPPGVSLWDGDGLLIAIDPEADAEARFGRRLGREDDNDTLVHVCPTATGARLAQYHGMDVADPRERVEDRAQVVVHSDDRTTVYEVALPLASLLINRRERLDEGSRLGIGIAVVDTAGGVRIMEFGAGIVDGLNAAALLPCVLVNRSADKSRYLATLRKMLPDHPAAPRAAPEPEPLLVQNVALDSHEPPRAIAVVCRSRLDGFNHGAYWADSPDACDGFVRPAFRYMGKLPSPGAWHELRVPAWSIGLANHDLLNVGWAVKDGKAWWDRTRWVAPGAEDDAGLLLVSEPPDGKPVFTGSGFGEWTEGAPGNTRSVHAPSRHAGWCFYYGIATNTLVNGRENLSKNRTPEQWLEECRKVASALRNSRMLPDFLRKTERLPLSSAQLADLYREVIQAHPDSSWTHRLLVRLLLQESNHAVVRRRYSLWLDRGVAHDSSDRKSGYKPLRMGLARTGRKWRPDVPGRSPTFNVSNHSGIVQDLHAPVTRIPITMNIGYDPWVKGDTNAPYTLSLHVQPNGVVYGSYVRTFRKQTLAAALAGRCIARYATTQEDGAPEAAIEALRKVRRFARRARVSRRQRRLFERALTHPADPSGL